jgi:orotidine-5'-phosphate decarboxylase
VAKEFLNKLESAARKNRSLLCVGLDPDPDQMPVRDLVEFNKAIIEATQDLVCAYKPNMAFYESIGIDGLHALEATLSFIPPEIPVIGDAKRGDIGNTAERYAKSMFELWDFDATTVNAFGGLDSIEPFLDFKERGVLVWCHSSNSGSQDFQELLLEDGIPFYIGMAQKLEKWRGEHQNLGMVVGATYPTELEQIRNISPDSVILIPGVGAQEGELSAAVVSGIDSYGRKAIINSSRQVLYASTDPSSYPSAARKSAQSLRQNINSALESIGKAW